MGSDDSRRPEPRAEHVDRDLEHYRHRQQRGAAERAGASAVQPRTGRSLKYHVTNSQFTAQ